MKNKYEQAISKIERLEKDLEYARKKIDVTAFYWSSLTIKKGKYFGEKEKFTVIPSATRNTKAYKDMSGGAL